jgi:hypothetical protein
MNRCRDRGEPPVEASRVRPEMQRGAQQHQTPDALRVQGGEQGGEGSPQGMTGQHHRPRPLLGSDRLEAAENQAVGIIGQTERLSGPPGPLPIHQVNRPAAVQHAPNYAGPGQEVPNVAALDRRRDDQQDRAGRGRKAIAAQGERRHGQHRPERRFPPAEAGNIEPGTEPAAEPVDRFEEPPRRIRAQRLLREGIIHGFRAVSERPPFPLWTRALYKKLPECRNGESLADIAVAPNLSGGPTVSETGAVHVIMSGPVEDDGGNSRSLGCGPSIRKRGLERQFR